MQFQKILIENISKLLEGSFLTLELTFTAFLLGFLMVMPIAIARVRAAKIWQYPIMAYVSFIRGTPLITQLFLVYYGSGQFREEFEAAGLWDFFAEPYNCALFTFTLNTLAFQIEILRGGIQNVPTNEVEAAKAIGMSRLSLYRRIVIPHAYRIAFPALGNELIILLKASAIVGVVTIYDLLGTTRVIFAKTFDFSVYVWAAIMYIMITTFLVYVWRLIERAISPHVFNTVKKEKLIGGLG